MRLLPQMFGVEAQVGIGMKDLGKREPAFDQSRELRPRHPTFLATTPKRSQPALADFKPKAF